MRGEKLLVLKELLHYEARSQKGVIWQDSSLEKVGEIKIPCVDRIKGLAGRDGEREEMIMQQREFGRGAQPSNNILP